MPVKKSLSIWIGLIWLLCAIYPVCQVAAMALGMGFTLRSEPGLLVAIMGISALVAASLIKEKAVLEGAASLLAMLLPVVAAANGVYIALFGTWTWSFVPIAAGMAAALIILIRSVAPGILKIFSVALGLILAVALIFVLSFDYLYSAVGRERTIAELPSPDGSLCARLVEREADEQGPGEWRVEVQEQGEIDVFIGTFRPLPRQLVILEEENARDIPMAWQEDKTLLVGEEIFSLMRQDRG